MLFRVLRLTANTLLNITEKKTPDEFHIWQLLQLSLPQEGNMSSFLTL